jgi:hypothetical protein
LPSRANISRFVFSDGADAWLCLFCKGPLETLGLIFLECITAGFSTKSIAEWILAIIFPVEKLAILVPDVNKFLFLQLINSL